MIIWLLLTVTWSSRATVAVVRGREENVFARRRINQRWWAIVKGYWSNVGSESNAIRTNVRRFDWNGPH